VSGVEPAGALVAAVEQPLIPEAVKRLILDKIDSVAEMESLLLLRSEPDHDWEAEEVAARIYVGDSEAARLLETLSARGFFSRGENGSFHYRPVTDELRDTVEVLADTYRTRLIPVTKLIHSKSSSGSSLQKFADAFRLRKDT